MTEKTKKDLMAEKRAAALRENLKRRKEFQAHTGHPQPDTKTEKK